MSSATETARGPIERELRALGASLTFLTRIPLGSLAEFDGDDVARSSLWFPLIGAGAGAAVGAVATGLAHSLTPLLAAALAVAVGTLLTGAMHIDGIGDTADGLGARTRERSLEVMRESTVGAYGVVAIVLDLVVRVSVLDELVVRHDAIVVAAMSGALSRMSPVILSSLLPYARAGAGLGQPFTRGGRTRAVIAVVMAVSIAIVLGANRGAVAVVAALCLTGVVGIFYQHWLSGVTGDMLGAASEVVEVSVLVLMVALMGHA